MTTKPRILWTLYRVWRVWRRCPEQRLGQLIANSTRGPHDLFDMHHLFNLYDEDLVMRLDAFTDTYLR